MPRPQDRTRVTRKAYAYITRGHDVLILTDLKGKHTGLRQIPGGTIEPGEMPEQTVLRECFEETGLPGLAVQAYIGFLECPCLAHDDEWQERHYFHVIADPPADADAWDHIEMTPSAGGDPIPIHLAFEAMDGTEMECWSQFGHFLPSLARRLSVPPRA